MNRFIEEPPDGASGWKQVWHDDLKYKPERSPSLVYRFLLALFTPLFERASRQDQERQRNFNIALLELIGDLRADVSSVSGDLTTVKNDLLAEIRSIQQILPITVRRNDALIAAVDQKLENLAARVRDLSTPLLVVPNVGTRNDFLYRRMEEGLRGSEAEVRAALLPYVEYAQHSQPIVDIGCGRGEFLVLCRERSLDVRGFDTNERSISDLRARGLNVDVRGIPDCFDAIPSAKIGSIFASHVVEHLPADVLTDLFSSASRVLRPGGLFMIETPNAESLKMSASDFWRDPTHIAPRHAGALGLLAREFGFEVDEVSTVGRYPEGNRLQMPDEASGDLGKLIARLNGLLFADQNLRLILRKGQ